jgi:hypothetical protein
MKAAERRNQPTKDEIAGATRTYRMGPGGANVDWVAGSSYDTSRMGRLKGRI